MSMPAAAAYRPPEQDDLARLRLISRIGIAYALDSIAITRGDSHVLDTLLVSTIIQANVHEVSRRGDLQVVFAETDEIPPDEIRRPVSMNALATSLELPFETVRRRVTGLAREGACRFVEGGVIVPVAFLADPKFFAAAFQGFERLRAFYYQLDSLGLLRNLPPPAAELSNNFPIRAVARLGGSYLLRFAEALGATGDLLDGLILLEVFRANVAHVPPDWRGETAHGPADLLNDEARIPAPAALVARRLGAPQETVRRHVAGLIARGACVRGRGGLIVPGSALANPRLRIALEDNARNLQRLFATLSQLGVLRVWDGVRPVS